MSFREALRFQARSNESLGSPFTARILTLLAERLERGTPLTDRLFDWPGDIGPGGASVPLRLLGALHALVLSGAAPGLAAVSPPNGEVDNDRLWAAIAASLRDHAAMIGAWIDNPPQTNEVRRAAVLIAAGHWLSARYRLPLCLSELGASAGLNLNWDRFALDLGHVRLGPDDAAQSLAPEWTGPLPPDCPAQVTMRRGVDINPLDPQNPQQALRLMSYLWADQPERLERTRAAIAVHQAMVDRADAAGWLEDRLARPAKGHIHLIYHTVAWQYFPEETKARCRAAIEKAGRSALADSPIAWLGMEADGGKGAALWLRIWPGEEEIALGRADFHGRWVNWAVNPPTGTINA